MTSKEMNSVRQFIDYARQEEEKIIEYARLKDVTVDDLIEVINMVVEREEDATETLAIKQISEFLQQKERIFVNLATAVNTLSKGVSTPNTMLAMTSTELSRKDSSKSGFPTVLAEKVSEISKISGKNLENQVTDIIRKLGVPASIKGYYYLRYALVYLVGKDLQMISMTKDLYPDVAIEFKTTSQKVERAMRTAIETAWERGDVEEIEKYFGYTVNSYKGKPTNSEFLFMIADYLKNQ